MKILIDLDEGFIARIERERQVAEYSGSTEEKPGKRPPRTATIRELLSEAMDKRCLDRGEEIPIASPEPNIQR